MLFNQIQEAIKYINGKTPFKPKTGIVLGTGLGSLTEDIEITEEIPYENIPHFPTSTVESHDGKLVFGHLSDVPVVAMSGRFHYYEGYSMQQVTFPIRVLKYLGIENLIISNAAGSINQSMKPGHIVFIRDHINLHPENPLRGENDERLGPRFPDMLNTYEARFIEQAFNIAREHQIPAHKGVYVGLQGPNLETPAEYNYLHIIGGDVVGMSTVPEVLVARHMNLPVLVASVVSNLCYPIETITETTIEDVIEVVNEATPKLTLIVKKFLKEVK